MSRRLNSKARGSDFVVFFQRGTMSKGMNNCRYERGGSLGEVTALQLTVEGSSTDPKKFCRLGAIVIRLLHGIRTRFPRHQLRVPFRCALEGHGSLVGGRRCRKRWCHQKGITRSPSS